MGMSIMERLYICQNASALNIEFLEVTDQKMKAVCKDLQEVDHLTCDKHTILIFKNEICAVRIFVQIKNNPENEYNYEGHIESWHIAPNPELNPGIEEINKATSEFLKSVQNLLENY